MTYGTLTFMFEGTEDEVQEAQERITKIIAKECPDLVYNVTEDTWDDEKTPVFDEVCDCLMEGLHRLSMHGTSPEWDAQHYWTRNAKEVWGK